MLEGLRPWASLPGINLIVLSGKKKKKHHPPPLYPSAFLAVLCSTHSCQGLCWHCSGRNICMLEIKIRSFCQCCCQVIEIIACKLCVFSVHFARAEHLALKTESHISFSVFFFFFPLLLPTRVCFYIHNWNVDNGPSSRDSSKLTC